MTKEELLLMQKYYNLAKFAIENGGADDSPAMKKLLMMVHKNKEKLLTRLIADIERHVPKKINFKYDEKVREIVYLAAKDPEIAHLKANKKAIYILERLTEELGDNAPSQSWVEKCIRTAPD